MSEAMPRRFPRLVAGMVFLAALVLSSPLKAQDAAKVAKGDSLFNGKQMGACWACHGKGGKGTGIAPNLGDKEWLNIDGSEEAIKGVITNGVPKPKKAKAPMPPMGGAKLTPEQIDDLAAYVFSLRSAGKKK